MEVFERVADWRARRAWLTGSLGFVATMGSLHAGHLSLIERSLEENDATLVSIFVEPRSVADGRHPASQPDRLALDKALLIEAGVPFLLLPSRDELCADGRRYRVSEAEFSKELGGAQRPGRFDEMLTATLKLLNIAGAARSYFGEKDHQELRLVQGMAAAFFLTTDIVACPTVRDPDGLALGSDNARLTAEERARAPLFVKALIESVTAEDARTSLEAQGFAVDYVEDRDGRRLSAVRLGDVRLIDNVVLG